MIAVFMWVIAAIILSLWVVFLLRARSPKHKWYKHYLKLGVLERDVSTVPLLGRISWVAITLISAACCIAALAGLVLLLVNGTLEPLTSNKKIALIPGGLAIMAAIFITFFAGEEKLVKSMAGIFICLACIATAIAGFLVY